MELVLNEYSFDGQFESTEEFAMWVYEEWISQFDYIVENRIVIYKKQDFYSKLITTNTSIEDFLRITNDPIVWRVKEFIINAAYAEPYWDAEGEEKTDLKHTYRCPNDDDLPNCFSEAIERDKAIVSAKNKDFVDTNYLCYKDDQEEVVDNITGHKTFLKWLLKSENADVKYVFENYRFKRKIKMAEINGRCYAEEAIQNNDLTTDDKENILSGIAELIKGLDNGTKNRFWDNLSNGVFEYRISISSGREFRILFFQDESIIFLNGFIKKTQKTPKREIEKAKDLMREMKS